MTHGGVKKSYLHFLFASVCFETCCFCFGCFDSCSKHQNKPKNFFFFGFMRQTEADWVSVRFGSDQNYFFCFFEDTLRLAARTVPCPLPVRVISLSLACSSLLTTRHTVPLFWHARIFSGLTESIGTDLWSGRLHLVKKGQNRHTLLSINREVIYGAGIKRTSVIRCDKLGITAICIKSPSLTYPKPEAYENLTEGMYNVHCTNLEVCRYRQIY